VYTAAHARRDPDKPAIIMEPSGTVITYGEFDTRANRLAHLFRSLSLERGDHVAFFMENHVRYLELCAAADRCGLYYTCVNSYAALDELAYIVDNCDAQLVITSASRRGLVTEALEAGRLPQVQHFLSVDEAAPPQPFLAYEDAVLPFPGTAVADEQRGAYMLYSSGTTGRPKGVWRPLSDLPVDQVAPFEKWLIEDVFQFRPDMTYLCASPVYHAAPLSQTGAALRVGATIVLLERFDAEYFLACIEKHRVTNLGPVPTMFVRLLKLPDDVRKRYDVSSLRCVVHQSAPCPPDVKQAMIDWWGPVLVDFYGASESHGFTVIDSPDWLAHRGSVGRAALGELHILDEAGLELPTGGIGTVYFKGVPSFKYYKDEEQTRSVLDPSGTMASVGDLGYVDVDGYLYLTERQANLILTGGVNVYPREVEDVLITHPAVYDLAVIGVPNEEYGEEVRAVVQVDPRSQGGPDLAAELIAYARSRLAHFKCPRAVDFVESLPRSATGKLLRRELRDMYATQPTST
jgi:acyl-CoA synthetase (AMP-forming)/AMP-acid ligase II